MNATGKLISYRHPSFHLSHQTPDCFIWNTLIRICGQNKLRPGVFNTSASADALSIFLRMLFHGVKPDFYTYPFLLQMFCSPSDLPFGNRIHGRILASGLDSNAFIQTSLINMYSNCDDFSGSQKVFVEISQPDLSSWNSIILANLRFGFANMARKLFDTMPERDVISWSCMIDGYVKRGNCKEALALFRDMQALNVEDVKPNGFTMSSVLSACGQLGALEHGKWVHAYVDKCGIKVDAILGTSLIDMYSKCGSIDQARKVFNSLGNDKDLIAWTSMISALAMHGHANESLDLFSQMQYHGITPNSITFLGVLCACVHKGLVKEGAEYFRKMKVEFGIVPTIEHFGCMVDLYARAGLIEEAWDVVKSMPMKPDVLIWGALLSGSRMCGDIESCESAIKKLIEVEPMNNSAYVLLSNVYAKMGKWENVRYVRSVMVEKGIKKVPGCSLVEIGGVVHEFFVGDESHPDTKQIYLMLNEIIKRIQMEGYVADTREVLLDLDQQGKEFSLSVHSEKLALAFSFIKTNSGSKILMVKNLRICGDCHVAMKIISRVYNREIVVRDCSRFHHFNQGACSCKDYW